MDLFEKVQDRMQCEYMSDIRFGANLKIARQVVAALDLSEYSLSELRDMVQYLYGGSYINLQKEEVAALLKNTGSGIALGQERISQLIA